MGLGMSNSVPRWLAPWQGFIVLAILILIWRRPDQFSHPYIWVEEGTVTLPAYLAHGWRSLLDPVAGYIVLPAKLIFLSAASLSFSHLPRLEYWFTLIFEAGTLALIAFSPSKLKFPILAALAVALLPTDSEVYSVSEYAFWWGALWSFVAIFWNEDAKPRTAWRCVLAGMGGLSSPMAIPAAVILAFRAVMLRTRSDIIVFGVAAATAAVQLYVMRAAGAMGTPNLADINLSGMLTKLAGDFALSAPRIPEAGALMLGALMAVCCLAYAVIYKKWKDPYFLMLAASLAASVFATVSRIPISAIHPFLAGPRYFFFPYIFLAWLLLYMLPEIGKVPRYGICIIFLGAFIQFAIYSQRHNDHLSWRAELAKCSAAGDETYPFAVHFDGALSRAWNVPLTGKECNELKQRALFH